VRINKQRRGQSPIRFERARRPLLSGDVAACGLRGQAFIDIDFDHGLARLIANAYSSAYRARDFMRDVAFVQVTDSNSTPACNLRGNAEVPSGRDI